MRPQVLLPILLGGAIGAGGILQGLKWRNAAASAGDEDLAGQLVALQQEVELLQRENESLRSLAQGGGEFQVAPALIDFAENGIGLDFRSSPVVHRIATEELRGRITASIESRFPPNSLDHRQQAWSAMGLLTPNDRYAPQLAITRSQGARSWFDDQTGEAWVTDAFDTESVPDQSALLRSLVRILLHQHYPPSAGYPGDDADLARTALHHGAAMAIENRFLARQALSIGFSGTMDEDTGARELLASLPIFIRGLATFPSQLGLPRAERLLDQEELLGDLHSPPTLTASYFPLGNELLNSPPDVEDSPGELVLEESLGMLGLQLWLGTIDPEITKAALAWQGDRYHLHARSETQLDLTWTIRLANSVDARSVLETALVMAGALADMDTDPEENETVTSPDGRRLRARLIEGNIVEFTNFAAE